MKILVNRTALRRAIANAAGGGPLRDEQRKAMFARQGQQGPSATDASRPRTTISKGGTSTTTIPAPKKPQPAQPVYDPIIGAWRFPPGYVQPPIYWPLPVYPGYPTYPEKPPVKRPPSGGYVPPKVPPRQPIDGTYPYLPGIPERPPIGSPPPKYYIPSPTPKPQPKPVAPKPVPKPAPTPIRYYEPPPKIVAPNNPTARRPWM